LSACLAAIIATDLDASCQSATRDHGAQDDQDDADGIKKPPVNVSQLPIT
jgi:hypothetical protein